MKSSSNHTYCSEVLNVKYWALFLVVFIPFSLQAQFAPQGSGTRDSRGSVYGQIHGASGGQACRVELREVLTGESDVQDCANGGRFEFSPVRISRYTITVWLGTQEQQQQLAMRLPEEEVDFTFNSNTGASPGALVSVEDLQVPETAVRELRKASDALGKSDLISAEQHVEKSLSIAPRFGRAVVLKAAILLLKGDLTGAEGESAMAVSLNPKLPVAHIVRASVLNGLHRWEEAQRSANYALQLEGNSWEAHYELSRSYAGIGTLSSALAESEKAQKAAPPEFAGLPLLRAAIFEKMQNHEAAVRELKRYSAFHPGKNNFSPTCNNCKD
jgi:tetratricopeptide (TPR) repeat protein